MHVNGSKSATTRDDGPKTPTDDDGIDIPILDHDAVRVTIGRLKNNKTVGVDRLLAGLIKYKAMNWQGASISFFAELAHCHGTDWTLSV